MSDGYYDMADRARRGTERTRFAWLDAAQALAICAAYVADARRDGDYEPEIHDSMLQAKVDEWRAAAKAYFGEDES